MKRLEIEPDAWMWTILVDRCGHRDSISFPSLYSPDETEDIKEYVKKAMGCKFIKLKSVVGLFDMENIQGSRWGIRN